LAEPESPKVETSLLKHDAGPGGAGVGDELKLLDASGYPPWTE